jgi:hypothetical protein
MSDYANQERPKIIKNAFDDAKMRISAPPPKGSERWASFGVGFVQNQPRFIVRTNVESDDRQGFAQAAMDQLAFYFFLDRVEDVIEGRATKYTMENDTGKMSERVLDSKLVVMREDSDADGKKGCIFVALLKKGITPVKFYLDISVYHRVYNLDGTEMNAAERSNLAARAWVGSIRTLLPAVAAKEFVVREYNQQNNNRPQAAGGYNNNRPQQHGQGPDTRVGNREPISDDTAFDGLPM